MTEIYFINDYFVRATSWKNAFISWLKYLGDLTDVMKKAILAMDTVKDIMELVPVFTSEDVDYYGVAKELNLATSYIKLHDGVKEDNV